MIDWKPGAPAGWFTGSVKVTATEAKLLDSLSFFEMKDFRDIKDKAETTANARYPVPENKRGDFKNAKDFAVWAHNDGHNDAFRHAYWNALMIKRFNTNFAQNYANAHEGVAGNPATREAMDLYNNSVGRRIALEHPGASDEELANLVQQAVERGDMVVIDKSGHLVWSNQVAYGEHGLTDNSTLPGVLPGANGNAKTES